MPHTSNPKVVFALVAILGASLAGCESSRERPVGPGGQTLPPTSVTIVRPITEDVVAADSLATVVIEASGLLRAMELVLTRRPQQDTLAWDRVDFGDALEFVYDSFEVRIPHLETGIHLEMRAVAEDVIGGLHESEAVVVIVIDCEEFPLACGP
jgi:hypothetical protein